MGEQTDEQRLDGMLGAYYSAKTLGRGDLTTAIDNLADQIKKFPSVRALAVRRIQALGAMGKNLSRRDFIGAVHLEALETAMRATNQEASNGR